MGPKNLRNAHLPTPGDITTTGLLDPAGSRTNPLVWFGHET